MYVDEARALVEEMGDKVATLTSAAFILRRHEFGLDDLPALARQVEIGQSETWDWMLVQAIRALDALQTIYAS